MSKRHVILCPGQGAQAVGMGKAWFDKSSAARGVFEEADRVLGTSLGTTLSGICFNGPADRLNQTDVSQPAIYACSIASWRGLLEKHGDMPIAATAGLSLGEYTAMHIVGVFDFATGLNLVAERGRLMQEAAVASKGGMVALIGADNAQAQTVCDKTTAIEGDGLLVCANFNAPGQVVLSGSAEACQRAVAVAGEMGLKATTLAVAGAFHSPLMQPAADRMGRVLAEVTFSPPRAEVWSNVTARPHEWGGGGGSGAGGELLKRRLVEQIVSPVLWSQTCAALASGADIEYHELAPGTVLRGLMRRIDRERKVQSHDQPED